MYVILDKRERRVENGNLDFSGTGGSKGKVSSYQGLLRSSCVMGRVKVLNMTLLRFPSWSRFFFWKLFKVKWEVRQNKTKNFPELYLHARATHSEDTHFSPHPYIFNPMINLVLHNICFHILMMCFMLLSKSEFKILFNYHFNNI